MTFGSIEALEAALVKAATAAVAQVEGQVYGEFKGSLSQYYGEFTPAEYIRTGALTNSLERTGVRSTGSGAAADVYFTTPSYQNGLIPIQSTPITGRLGYATWSGGQVLDTAMHGSHGGYVDGTAIWDDSLSSLGDIKGKLLAAVKANL